MPKYYFPSTPSRALLSVVKKRCVHFVGFRDPAHAVKVCDTMNANYPVFLDGAHVRCSSDMDLVVVESELDDLGRFVSEFGVHVCAFEEPDRLVVERTLLGPGHKTSWSLSEQRVVCMRAFGLDP
jgi:hypothetical protein